MRKSAVNHGKALAEPLRDGLVSASASSGWAASP